MVRHTLLLNEFARHYLFSTSSRFISSFASIVHAASAGGSSVGSAFDSPTAISFFASSGFAL